MATTPEDELGIEYETLRNHIYSLHAQRDTLKQMFKGKRELDLLRAVSPNAAGMIWHSLWNDIILRLCRLTDEAEQRKFLNLTLERIVNLLTSRFSDAEKGQIKNEAAQIRKLCAPLRAHRDKRIAHTDRMRAIDDAFVWEQFNSSDIEQILGLLLVFMNDIGVKFGSQYGTLTPINGTDVASLLLILEKGQRFIALQKNLAMGMDRDEVIKKLRAYPRTLAALSVTMAN